MTRTQLSNSVPALAAIVLATVWTMPVAGHERHRPPSPIIIDPPGAVDSRPFGITDSRDIVGLYFTSDGKGHGFLLTRGVYTSIDVPGAVRTNAVGIAELRGNDDDRQLAVVGRYDTADPNNANATIGHGYLLTGGTLTPIDHPDTATFTVTTGINSSGHIVGRYRHDAGDDPDGALHGFTLVDGVFEPIDYPGASQLFSVGINDRGDLAGYYADATGRSHGFVRLGGVFTTVDPPDSMGTGGNAGIVGINSQEFVGYYRVAAATLPCGCDGLRGFSYSLRDESFQTFAVDSSIGTTFAGINRRGDIVGGYVSSEAVVHGLLILGADRKPR